MRSGALDYADQNIRFNTVCPGGTGTAMLDQVIEDLADHRRKQDLLLDYLAEPSNRAEITARAILMLSMTGL